MMKPFTQPTQHKGVMNNPQLLCESVDAVTGESNFNSTTAELNRLSLELMLLDRGEISPVAFHSQHEAEYSSTSGQQNLFDNRLSLELMLLDRGEISPVAFHSQHEAEYGSASGQQNLFDNRLSLELMLLDRGEISPVAFHSQHEAEHGSTSAQRNSFDNLLSLELMLLDRGETSPVAFPCNSKGEDDGSLNKMPFFEQRGLSDENSFFLESRSATAAAKTIICNGNSQVH